MNSQRDSTAANAAQIANFMTGLTSSDALGITAQQSIALGATFVNLGQDASDASTRFQASMTQMIAKMDTAAEYAGMDRAAFKALADQDIIDATNKELKLKRETFEDLKNALSGLNSKEMAEGKDEKTISYDQVVDGQPPIRRSLTLSRRASFRRFRSARLAQQSVQQRNFPALAARRA
jgi:hypothetical protein